MKKKIGIIGQFSPPIHGLSKALDTLYNSYLGEKYDLTKFDITNNKKFLSIIFKLIKSNLDIYYLTISQSKFGNLRDLIILKIIQMKKKKSIIHLHGGGFRNVLEEDMGNFQRKLNYKILGKVDCGIVLGESLKYIFEGIIDKDRIKVVKNCVDDEFVISDEEFEEKMKIFKEKKVLNILYLSNFIEDKGYKDVLNLAKLCKEKNNKKFNFIFAGKFFDENDKNWFFKFIEDNSLKDIIEYKGIVGGEEKKKLFKESDYFILLTRYKNEGQPISIIEAGINGLGIITTNHAGIKDILKEDRMLVFDKNKINIDVIYKRIIKECNKDNILNILVKNRKDIKKEFIEKDYLKSLEFIFDEIEEK